MSIRQQCAQKRFDLKRNALKSMCSSIDALRKVTKHHFRIRDSLEVNTLSHFLDIDYLLLLINVRNNSVGSSHLHKFNLFFINNFLKQIKKNMLTIHVVIGNQLCTTL